MTRPVNAKVTVILQRLYITGDEVARYHPIRF